MTTSSHQQQSPPEGKQQKTPNGYPPPKELEFQNSGLPPPSGDLQPQSSYNDSSSKHSATSEELNNNVNKFQRGLKTACRKHSSVITNVILFLLLVGYTIYFVFAIMYNVEWAMALIVLTGLTLFIMVYVFIRDRFGGRVYESCWLPVSTFWDRNYDIIKWFLYPALGIASIMYLSLAVVTEVRQLQSISGMIFFFFYTYITSKHPTRIYWRPVIWGFSLQFVFAIMVLQWEYGYIAVSFLAKEITKFMNYAYDGAAVVFGDPFLVFHPFAFMGMPILLYIGAVMSILYYCGITQIAASKTAWLMQKTMGTTAIETLGVAANIFLNGNDCMLMLRSYLTKMTKSEFHCFLCGGHATVAGFAFGIFVLFGAPPQHLLSAAVMSAPATIAIAKLNYPETEESITKRVEDIKLERGDDVNVFEAGANGASVAGKTVAAVVVNYIAFLGLLAWINATLSWLGGRVGFPQLSFELMCSYIFWPLSLLMGVDLEDCQEAAKLVGIKVFASEVLAYQQLGVSVANGLLNPRSQAIVTYALCGFSSISTLAIAVGVWHAVCPERVGQMASQMLRVLVNANLSCFMTACVAGIMYNSAITSDVSTTKSPTEQLIMDILGRLPSYKDLMGAVGM